MGVKPREEKSGRLPFPWRCPDGVSLRDDRPRSSSPTIPPPSEDLKKLPSKKLPSVAGGVWPAPSTGRAPVGESTVESVQGVDVTIPLQALFTGVLKLEGLSVTLSVFCSEETVFSLPSPESLLVEILKRLCKGSSGSCSTRCLCLRL